MSSRTTSSPLSHCQLFWLDSVLNLEASCCSETSYHNSLNYNLNMLVHLRTVLRRVSRPNRHENNRGGGEKISYCGSAFPPPPQFGGLLADLYALRYLYILKFWKNVLPPPSRWQSEWRGCWSGQKKVRFLLAFPYGWHTPFSSLLSIHVIQAATL